MVLPPRRTQAERTATTRRRLLDATVAALVELGASGVTTTEVARRAGVSQGALFRHFPTKGALLAAAVEDLFPRMLEGARARVPTLPVDAEARAGAVIDLLWEEYERPELQAAVELYMAARTDRDLAAALGRVEHPHRQRVHALAAELVPELAGATNFAGLVDVVVDAVQGASMGRLHVLDPDAAAAGRAAMRATLTQLLIATPVPLTLGAPS